MLKPLVTFTFSMGSKKKKQVRGYAITSVPKKQETVKQVEIKNLEPEPDEMIQEAIVICPAPPVEIDYKKELELFQKQAIRQNLMDVEIMESHQRNSLIPSLLLLPAQESFLSFNEKIPVIVDSIEFYTGYFRLLDLGFSKSMVQDVCAKFPFYSFVDLIQQICYEYSLESLPTGWGGTLDNGSVHPVIVVNSQEKEPNGTADITESIFENEGRIENTLPPIVDVVEANKVNKRWILENCFSDSDSDGIEVIQVPSVDEEKQRYIGIWNEIQLAKQARDKQRQKELGKKFGKLKLYLIEIGVDVDSIVLDTFPQKVVAISESEDNEMNFDLFPQDLESVGPTSYIVEIKDYSYSSRGVDVCQLLEEILRKTKVSISYKIIQSHSNGYQCKSQLKANNEIKYFETTDILKTPMQAKEWCAARALYELFPTHRYEKRLPLPFARLWNEWIERDELELLEKEMKEYKHHYEFLQSLKPPQIAESLSRRSVVPETSVQSLLKEKSYTMEQWESRNDKRKYYFDVKKSLPVTAYYETIVQTVDQNQVVVISGETGSGKSTQIPQFLMQDAIQKGCSFSLVCTQVY
jgi:hypothetical protein